MTRRACSVADPALRVRRGSPGPPTAQFRDPPSQVLVALGAILLTGPGLAAVPPGEEARMWHAEPDAILILVAYLLLLVVATAEGLA